jgi:hypothetical protein
MKRHGDLKARSETTQAVECRTNLAPGQLTWNNIPDGRVA